MAIDGSPRAQAARNRDPYDLTELRVFSRAILEVKDHYVEPDRVKPRRMLLGSLNAIQRTVGPVLIHYEDFRYCRDPIYRHLSMANCQALVLAATGKVPKAKVLIWNRTSMTLAFEVDS